MVIFLQDYEALEEWELLEEKRSLREKPVPMLLFNTTNPSQPTMGSCTSNYREGFKIQPIQGVTGGTDQTSGGCSLC